MADPGNNVRGVNKDSARSAKFFFNRNGMHIVISSGLGRIARPATPKSLFKGPERSNMEEEIASTCRPSRNQTHKVCKGTWSTEP